MNRNPFSTENLIPVWKTASEVLKGDVEGHEFHGNQYTGGGAATGGEHWQRAKALAQRATEVRQGPAIQANYHEMADRHMVLGNELNQMVRQAQAHPHQDSQIVKDDIRGGQLAAQAHFAAAKAYDDIANGKVPYGAGQQEAQRDQAEALSHVAAFCSINPMGLGSGANGQ